MKNLSLILSCGLLLTTSAGFAAGPSTTGSDMSGNGAVPTKLYPPQSLKLREEGVVHYQVGLDRKGDLETCQVTRSSGHPRLDSATCPLLVEHVNFRPGLNAKGKPGRSTLNGRIVWKLPN